jgi:hypothetical protein
MPGSNCLHCPAIIFKEAVIFIDLEKIEKLAD